MILLSYPLIPFVILLGWLTIKVILGGLNEINK